MAASSLIPKNGAVAFGTYTADFASFDIDVSQAVDDVTPYGSNTDAKHVGSGTPTWEFNAGAFLLAHTTSAQPFLPGNTSTIFTSGGSTATFTLDTNCTYSCTAVLRRFRISHARMRGFAPAALSLTNGGNVTEAYATA